MQVPVPEILQQFGRSLTALKGVLAKANAYCEQKKVDFSVLAQTRLVPDQFPFGRQIQIASDNAKGCAARLAGVESPKMEDTEQTYEEFVARIDRTLAFLDSIDPARLEGYESRKVSFPWSRNHHLTGRDYLVQHAIPNFYFHVATAYSILRSVGVDLGKRDYLGKQNWQPSS